MPPTPMDDHALLRYSRHIILPEIDIAGQARITASRVLIIGAGGLGCPAALYLAAAGVGTLTICDDDDVELSNLQRQILHHDDRIGQLKVDSALDSLRVINPNIVLQAVPKRVAGALLNTLVRAHDVVLDCSDNFATRHAVNKACVAAAVPLVAGAAIQFAGQIGVFGNHGDETGPCYACLFPETDDQAADIRCAQMGVFAPLTGIIGSLQAAEALKLILAAGQPLSGRFVLFDALACDWQCIQVVRNPSCVVCAHNPETSADPADNG